MKFDNAGPRKVYNFDLDGVLAVGGPFWEREPEPNQGMIEKVRELYQAGNVIIIWTARLWEYAPETVGWLTKHKVPFHGIYMSKGGADVYVDDKAVNLEAWTGPTVRVMANEPNKGFRWTGDEAETTEQERIKRIIREKLGTEVRSKLRAEYAETEKRHEQTLKEVMEILRPLDKLGIAGLGLARAELQRRLEEG